MVIGDLANLDSAQAWTGTLFVATGAGLLGATYATRDRTVTAAMAEGYRFGLYVGAGNALLLGSPLGLYDGDRSSEKVNGSVFLTGTALGIAGMVYGKEAHPTTGQLAFAENMSLLGLASTWLGVAIAQPDNLDGDTALTLTAAGLDISTTAGLVIGRQLDWSNGRARMTGLGALLGGLGGLATGVLIGGTDSGRGTAATTLIGMWGGFGLTVHLTRGMRPDRGHALPKTAVMPAVMQTPSGQSALGAGISGVW